MVHWISRYRTDQSAMEHIYTLSCVVMFITFIHPSEGRLKQVNTVVYRAYMYHVFLACEWKIKVHI